jgi:hypothetical protein
MSDEGLRERFQALRETEAAEATSFEETLARAEVRGASPRSRWLWAPAAAAAAAALWLVLALPGSSPRPAPLDPGTWTMPTDVLLEVPGTELLREVPAIGTEIDGPSAPLRTGWNRRVLG